MRILNVHFKNLNSLPGEWKIDFTNQGHAPDGLFVITGLAGAGKSAVLDAICLALYGRTPRLKVTQGSVTQESVTQESVTQGPASQASDEIMSPQAGECFAEVTFEANTTFGANPGTKRYRAFWEQHRSRKRPDGALQPQRRELADAVTGSIVETKQQDVADSVRETIGLSFEQFVRSVLLAQGDFAAFLRCGPEARPPILEKITGTEIYAQLPFSVHEIKNAEKIALNLIEAEAAGFKDINPDDTEELKPQLSSLRQEEADAVKDLELRGVECDWLSGIASLQKELDSLIDRQTDLARRQEGFNSERLRLARAQKALEFGSVYSALVMLRREQEGEKQVLLDCRTKLPELEAGVRRSEDDLQLVVSASSDRQADRKNILALLHNIRELDIKQKEKEAPIAEMQEAAEELAVTIKAQRERLEAEHIELETAQVQMRDVLKFLQNNAQDEKLIGQITGIKTRFDALEEFTVKRRRLGEERAGLEKVKNDTQKRLDGQTLLYETAKSKFTSLENSVKKQNGVLGETLGSRSIGEWRKNLANLMERKVKLGEIEETLRRRADISALLQELKGRQGVLESSKNECLKKTAARQEKVQALEKELRYLDVQAELILRIKELEGARGRLTDGQPCPLCGSASHPYAADAESIPQDGEVQLSIRRARDDLKNEHDALSELNAEDMRLSGEILQAEEYEARLQSQIKDVERSITDDLAAIQLSLSMDADPLTNMGRERQRSEEQLQKARLVVEKVEKCEEILRAMRDELEFARQDRDQLAASRQEAEFEKETATLEFGRIAQDIRLADEELKNIRLDLTRQVIPFGFKNLPDERPEQILEELSSRLERWQERNKLRVELEKRIAVWERDLHHVRTVLDSFNLELKDKNEAVKRLKAEINALKQQRISIFGDKDPDDEEVRHNVLVDNAERQVEAKREAKTVALHELSKMRVRIDDLVKSIHVRADSLQKTEISFKKQLIANDFGNEDAYLSACLPEAERKVLHERASALDREQVELDALQLDRKFALDELRRQHLTDLTLEEAKEKKIQAAARLEKLRWSVGSASLMQEEEEALSLKRTELAERLETQRAEYRRWEDLHSLIGSAGLQKDRGFLQNLIFEMLIRIANHQLQKMKNRYLLVKDESAPLSLSIIDNAGNRGSVKNLSEAESFIVSMALALGLSQMVSQKVKVGSLFLDGGFDTLSGEALDMAVSALAKLKGEGRLIGIISNSEQLKDRIAAHVEAMPIGEGAA